jgi:hypothetical protein
MVRSASPRAVRRSAFWRLELTGAMKQALPVHARRLGRLTRVLPVPFSGWRSARSVEV